MFPTSKSKIGYFGIKQASDQGILKYPKFSPFQGRSPLVNQGPNELSPWIQQTERQREQSRAQKMINHDKGERGQKQMMF